MIPRGTVDIGWTDLVATVGYCLLPGNAERVQANVEAVWTHQHDSLACLSVRSGFDLLLQVLALPAGSEVLISAITIPDMVYLLDHHGLVAIPIDIDPDTLAVDLQQLQRSIGPRTRAILIAHLFGSRMPLAPIIELAHRHGLLVIEDCAQAYDGSSYRGHDDCDVSMFSFGPIKMQTALGGALLRVHDQSLLSRLRYRQAQYPRQSLAAFTKRAGRFALLKALARPWLYALFIIVCRLRGVDHDALLNQAMRGFAGQHLLDRLRQQPSLPLLRLLHRRLQQPAQQRIKQRAAHLRRIVRMHPNLTYFGALALHHIHWVLPIGSSNPDRLVAVLRAHGFDATRKASSMVVVASRQAQVSTTTPRAQQIMDHLVYLPVSAAMTTQRIAHIRQIVMNVERQHVQPVLSNVSVSGDRT